MATAETEAVEFIEDDELGRRNLTSFQRAELALRLEPLLKVKEKAKQSEAGKEKLLQNSVKAVNTQKELAKAAGVSHDTVSRVKQILESATEDDQPGELDSISLDVHDIPSKVVEKFTSLPIEQLNRIAWTATEWSPGTFEKQIILQLRATFRVDFSRLGGSQMFHPDDNRDGGTGTMPETLKSAARIAGAKNRRRSQRPVDASPDDSTTESDGGEIVDCGASGAVGFVYYFAESAFLPRKYPTIGKRTKETAPAANNTPKLSNRISFGSDLVRMNSS